MTPYFEGGRPEIRFLAERETELRIHAAPDMS